MPYLYELDEARDDDPLSESCNYVTCWQCQHADRLYSPDHISLASDAVWCKECSDLIDTPHEPRVGDDAECWD